MAAAMVGRIVNMNLRPSARHMILWRGLGWTSSSEVRKKFIDFYVKCNDHQFIPSSPVRLVSDPTLLFVNAGMNQFKPKILDLISEKDALANVRRAANSQKCIRAGGKHNDLEDVGKDTFHHTFFEMLGSWSFGDYFKEKACRMALELLTEHFKIPVERLYFTYFSGDANLGLEADSATKDVWTNLGIPSDRILPFGIRDNFWEMGNTGPCGPCTEIHYDYRGQRNADKLVNTGHKDVVEIWNLVFMQYNRLASGELTPLPMNHVDTGMGLERIASILQGKSSNYETDLFLPIMDATTEICGCKKYMGTNSNQDVAYRIVSDHARMLTIAVSDGIFPGNSDAELVVRQVLRRAVLHGKKALAAPDGLLSSLVPVVVDTLSNHYGYLKERQDEVVRIVKEEELAFLDVLKNGDRIITKTLNKNTEGKHVFPLETSVYLYNHLGYPLDLLLEKIQQKNFEFDHEKFAHYQTEREELKQKGREKQEKKILEITITPGIVNELKTKNIPVTDHDVKYACTRNADRTYNFPTVVGRIFAIITEDGEILHKHCLASPHQRYALVTDVTPFCHPTGGQVSDTGVIRTKAGELEVSAVTYTGGYVFHHFSTTENVKVDVGDGVEMCIDAARRQGCMRAHTATHMLNSALRHVLGAQIKQDGSKVGPDELRYIFSGPAPSQSDITKLERVVASLINSDAPVTSMQMPLDEAMADTNIKRLDGETYPDPVNVVCIGDFSAADSLELCGGTHVQKSADVGDFAITLCKSQGRNKTRVECVTWERAQESQRVLASLQNLVCQKAIEVKDILSQEIPPLHQVGELKGEVGKLNYQVNSSEISTVCKAELKAKLRYSAQKLSSKMRALKKKAFHVDRS